MGWREVDIRFKKVSDLLNENDAEHALKELMDIHASEHFPKADLWRVWEHYARCYAHLHNLKASTSYLWKAICFANGEFIEAQRRDFSNYLFDLHYFDIDDDDLFNKHLLYRKIFGNQPLFFHEKRSHPRLRIGYLADTFSENILSYFTMHLLTLYDPSRFEIHCYGLNSDEDLVSAEISSKVTGWHMYPLETHPLCVANQIFQDQIDILFDFCGHASGGITIAVMAYKPAPVQISGIGYMSTTGLDAVDYFLSDPYCDEEPGNASLFSEKILRLPHSHFCFSPSIRLATRKKRYQVQTTTHYGSFNKFYKITDDMLAAWREILHRVPHSLIICRNGGGLENYDTAEKVLRQRARSAGFPDERFIIEPSGIDYPSRYMDIDIALDTYPYVGGATTCDALFLGVPVVSLYGKRHGTRFGYSLLQNTGLKELAVKSFEEYIALATNLANDKHLLFALHQRIPEMMQSSPVMNAKQHVRDLQEVYEHVWEKWMRNSVK